MYHNRFGRRNRFGADVRGSGLLNKIKDIVRKGVGVAVSTGGEILGNTLDNIDHPLAKVSSAVTKSVSKGAGAALVDGPSSDPVEAPTVKKVVQDIAKPMDSTEQIEATKKAVKRKASSSRDLLTPPLKTSRTRARGRKYPIQDIWD